MKTRPLVRQLPNAYPEEVYPFGSTQNVSTLTTLLAFTDLGSDYTGLKFTIENQDATNNVTLIVEPSHGGARPNTARAWQVVAAAGEEASIEASDPNPYTYFRITAQTDSGSGFPTVSVRWAVVGIHR